jgi:hypothetical protein
MVTLVLSLKLRAFLEAPGPIRSVMVRVFQCLPPALERPGPPASASGPRPNRPAAKLVALCSSDRRRVN